LYGVLTILNEKNMAIQQIRTWKNTLNA
jgi:hypothetical protein